MTVLGLSKSKDTNHQATIIGKDNKTSGNGQHACPSGASSVLNMGKHLAPSGHGGCPKLCPKFPWNETCILVIKSLYFSL